MSAVADWAGGALLGSTVMMLAVLAVRGGVRRVIGPRLAYALWLFPLLRMIVPPLPAGLFAAIPVATGSAKLSILFVGARGAGLWRDPSSGWQIATLLLAAWAIGAAVVFGLHLGRYLRFRRRLLASAVDVGERGSIRIVASAVDGPLAFGVVHPTIAVPLDFTTRFDPRERDLALAHECAHHARGDLIANWAALAVLALHWWNPVAWVAIHAFRDDQEFAVDAHVLARCDADARPAYARVLAKAAGLGTLSVCNLTARSNLKGRLVMLKQRPSSKGRVILGGSAVALLAATVLTATVSATGAPATGRQAVTIGVKPDGAGGYALIVGGKLVAAGAPLPGGATLPSDFDPAGGCDLKPAAKPHAMVLKGVNGNTTYAIMCANAAPASVRTTLGEGLASLKTMRASIATQPASAAFPETERTHALAAVDRSIHDVEGTLAKAG
ncbi:M56 family metallopeptidase [Polymorphobacter megasporae]|uniref:M56 family metallopeptidase n=1 Tax=Glacieibacterium megasporae TaxID=2835787 RepID=UPI001C1E4EAC|nr:M56 family metallopeptidase [Polymorphobacter megasporae]UAJ10187.1 M56 family metallopeptidase [Polymorphobacter megasporae]